MDRTKELDRLMRKHSITARQVGVIVGREPKTVRNWRSSADRTITAGALEKLKAALAKSGNIA